MGFYFNEAAGYSSLTPLDNGVGQKEGHENVALFMLIIVSSYLRFSSVRFRNRELIFEIAVLIAFMFSSILPLSATGIS